LGIGEVAAEQRGGERALRVGEQYGTLRSCEPGPRGSPFGHLLGGREEFDLAVELVLGLELLHQVLVGLDALRRADDLLRQDLRLEVVGVEHVPDDVSRARLEQRIAILQRELASLDREA